MNERYIRHIQLKEVGPSGQAKLGEASVLVVGAGGLGCPVLQYLAAAGVGKLGIVDFDVVSESNLQRQILFMEKDVGQNKAVAAGRKLRSMNSEITINVYPTALTLGNCMELISDYDIVVDGTDNFTTRYLINDTCIKLNKPMVYGSLYKFEGQVSVFNYKNGPSYRCLFPIPPKNSEVPSCSDIGILGVMPGRIGLIQATEVLKIILETGDVLNGKVLYLNALTNEQRLIELARNEAIIKSIKDRELTLVGTQDCAVGLDISLSELSSEEDLLWIDVREAHETPRIDLPNLECIPLGNLRDQLKQLNNSRKKIIFCQSGIRSRTAVQYLAEQNIPNCFNLLEGAVTIEQWLK
jgi:adenylyltransferase/sulfurtransferase